MRTRIPRVGLVRLFAGLSMTLAVVLSAAGASAQTLVPYYGKNQIRYDNFKWYIYTTDHFEIYYYPETEQHLERVASYAESAYQQISADLKHDLAFKVSMIIFKTSSEFQEQNVIPGAAHGRRRRVCRADTQPDAAAARRAAGSALPAHRPRAHAHLRVRHHPAVAHPPQRAAVGERRTVRLHDRLLDADRPDDGARRGRRRHRAEDDAISKATAASTIRA